MSNDNYPQTRTFKIVDKGHFAKDDFMCVDSKILS